MPPGRLIRPRFARLLAALSLCACLGSAWADDYAEVTQLITNGQLAQAMAKADEYLLAKPRDPQMRFMKGVIQTQSGQSDEAMATFTRLTQDYPELPEPYNNLGVLYAAQNQQEKAREALEMAVRLNPAYAAAHENLGDIHLRIAAQAYARAAQLEPANGAPPAKLAQVRAMLDKARPASAAPATPASAPPASR
jgi:Flp pilus assembly protein TadD